VHSLPELALPELALLELAPQALALQVLEPQVARLPPEQGQVPAQGFPRLQAAKCRPLP
jgi:hypothetical protein